MLPDRFELTVTLPDGRQVENVVYGTMHPAPDGFDIREKDAQRATWVGGDELDQAEFEQVIEVEGKPVELGQYLFDQTLDQGKFYPFEWDEDDFL